MHEQDVVYQRRHGHCLRIGDAGDARLGQEFDGRVGQAVRQRCEMGTGSVHIIVVYSGAG